MNNGEQLISFGIQLQNMGAQVQNFGMQVNNMIGIQLQNLGMQISSIGIQIFNIGKILNQSNNIENNKFEMLGQNQSMPMPILNFPQNFEMINNMNINGNENCINNNNLKQQKLNITFYAETGLTTNIVCNFKTSVEELLKIYAKRVGINMKDIYNKNIYFISNGYYYIDPNDKTEIELSPIRGHSIKVYKVRGLTN